MHLGEIVKKYRIENEMSMDEFAKRSGLSKGYISMLEKNENPKTKKEIVPTLETINSVADAIGVELDFLLSICGRGQKINLDSPMDSYINKIPLLGKIACGEPITAIENIEEYVCLPDFIKADFALTAQGDSMINVHINDGDIVFIRKQPTVESGEIAAVLIDDEATLKRVSIHGDIIVLSPENPNYPQLVYKSHEVKILGKAVNYIGRVK